MVQITHTTIAHTISPHFLLVYDFSDFFLKYHRCLLWFFFGEKTASLFF